MYRKAVIADISKISLLVNTYASSEEMLPRPMMGLLENMIDFRHGLNVMKQLLFMR
ncbi:MAG: hypothetical protein AB1765_09675 [Candidatus Hydrogenedentota bacterium]